MEENKLIMTKKEKEINTPKEMRDSLKEFLQQWSINKLEKMTLEEYTNLKDVDNSYFGYWLETKTKSIGTMSGRSSKYGIYRVDNKDKKTYKWNKNLGKTEEEAFTKVKQVILKIIEHVKNKEWKKIDEVKELWPIVKCKIAFLYSNEQLVPMYNRDEFLLPIAKYFNDRIKKYDNDKLYELSTIELNRFIFEQKETNQDLFVFYHELLNIHKEIKPTLKENSQKKEPNKTINEAIKIEEYNQKNFLEEVFIEENDFETIKALLERKKNIILQGAPGVGKTFAAKRIAYSMIGKKDENLIKIVQFHQNYSYEDFVEGYKPNENGSFKLKNGVFKEFCKEALKNLEECNKSEDEKSFEKKFEKAYNKLIEDIDENDVKIESKTGIVFNNIEIKPNNNLKIIKGKKPLHVSYDDLLKVAKKFKPQQEFSTTDISVFLNKGCHAYAYWAVLNHIYINYWSENNTEETKPTETIEKKKYFFIIDEINRGNLSKIFGELLMLIEDTHRGEKINLAYSGEEFCVPENVYIIGMMNTADRSLAMIDYALRRRFSFFEMQPAFENDKFKKIIKGENLEKVVEKIIELNNKICGDASLGKGFCIGHSYFCNLTDDNKETLKNIIDYEIAPMLKEYWFDDIQEYDDAIKLLTDLFKNDNSQEHSN